MEFPNRKIDRGVRLHMAKGEALPTSAATYQSSQLKVANVIDWVGRLPRMDVPN